MEYTLKQYIQKLDHDGNVTGVFITVNISDGEDERTQEYWLSPEEIEAVSKDEKAIEPIIEKVAAEGEVYLEEWKEVKPQSPIDILEKSEISFEISKSNVANLKSAIVQERRLRTP